MKRQTAAIQLPLLEPFTVHCFFAWCKHVVKSHDPQEAHALMEKHYADGHRQQIERATGVKWDAARNKNTDTPVAYFTVKPDGITGTYRARWLLPEHKVPQWFHERSMYGPQSIDAAAQEVLCVCPNAQYVSPGQFATILLKAAGSEVNANA